MKKITSFFLTFLIIMTLCSQMAYAKYSLVSNDILIPCDSLDISLPAGMATYETGLGTTYAGNKARYFSGAGILSVSPEIIKGGKYKIEYWRVPTSKNTLGGKIRVHHNDGVMETEANNVGGTAGFCELGTYTLSPGHDVVLELESSGWWTFDCFKFTLIEANGEVAGNSNDVLVTKYESDQYKTHDIRKNETNIPKIKEGAVEIYVENGKNGTGTKENPFGSIVAAQQYARKIIKSNYPENGIVIYLKGGTYELDSTVTFTAQDSGTQNSPIIYSGYDGDVNFVMGKKITDESKIDMPQTVYENFLADGKDKVIAVDLKKIGINYIPFVNSTTVPFVLCGNKNVYNISRYPNGSAQEKLGLIEEWGTRSNIGATRQRGTTYSISNPRQLRWKVEKDPMISGMYGPEYKRMASQIANINTSDMQFSIKDDCWIRPTENASYYVYNLLSEVDFPGEYYVDTDDLMLYYYPYTDTDNEMYLSYNTNKVFSFTGGENIVLQNINIVCGGSHGIEMDANTKNCYVMGMTFTGLAGKGIQIYGYSNVVRDCNFYNLNMEAINLSGGNAQNYTKGDNVAENNIVHDVSLSGSGAAVRLYQCGNVAQYNHIYDVPDKAIELGGSGNRAEWNRIERVCLQNSDTGAIYCYSLGMGYGTVVSHNYIKDVYTTSVGSQMAHGIYPDDYTCGTTIEGNVLINVESSAICLRGSFSNIDNNLIIYNGGPDFRAGAINTGPGEEFYTSKDEDGKTREERNIMLHDLTIPEYAQAKADLESGVCGLVRNVNFTNNAIFTVQEDFIDRDKKILQRFDNDQTSTYKGSTWFDFIPDVDFETVSDLDYSQIREQIPEFKDLNAENMGIYQGGLRNDDSYVLVNGEAKEFNLISPQNGQHGISKNVVLSWDDLVNIKGYEKATVYIAENPEMTDNLFSFDTIESTAEIECDFDKTYYWTVVGTERRSGEKMMAKDRIRSFTTISGETIFYNKLFEARSYIKVTSGGTRPYTFADNAKQELIKKVEEVEKKDITSIEDYARYTEELQNFIDEYKSKKNQTGESVNYIYYDYQSDCIGQLPYTMYFRHASTAQLTVEKDPTNNLNKAIRFKDTNIDGFGSTSYQYSKNSCDALMSFRRQTSGVIEFSASVMAGNDASCFAMALSRGGSTDCTDVSPNSFNTLSVIFNSDGKIYGDRNKTNMLCEFEKNKWYDVKVVLNCDKNTYDVYINGKLLAQKLQTYEDVTKNSVGQIRFSCTDGTDNMDIIKQTGTYYLDNVMLKGPDRKNVNPYLYNLSVNGVQLEEFALDKLWYEVDMTPEEFENAVISYKGDSEAKISVWQKNNVKYVVVLSGDYEHIAVYNIKNKGGE